MAKWGSQQLTMPCVIPTDSESSEWALAQGIHPETAYRWYRQGKLQVPAHKMGKLILMGDLEAPAPKELGRTVSTPGCRLLTREPIWAAKSPGWSPGQPSMATLSRR